MFSHCKLEYTWMWIRYWNNDEFTEFKLHPKLQTFGQFLNYLTLIKTCKKCEKLTKIWENDEKLEKTFGNKVFLIGR